MAITVLLFATYKDDRVGYIRMEQFWGICGHNLPFRYIDSAYTDGILSAYNTIHHTDFTREDLFEDECSRFSVLPGNLVSLEFSENAAGNSLDTFFISEEMKEFWPLIRDRDHKGIVRNCSSFNPTRKAFGAVCMYVLQERGEPLSSEEKRLLKNILHSNETIEYSSGCKHIPAIKIKTILSKKELHSIYIRLYGSK